MQIFGHFEKVLPCKIWKKKYYQKVLGQKIDGVTSFQFFLQCSSLIFDFFEVWQENALTCLKSMVKILKMPIFLFSSNNSLKLTRFWSKIVQEVPPNGHNYPLTEPKCKYLSILERSYYEKSKKNTTKSFGTRSFGTSSFGTRALLTCHIFEI
jgi:hypothetical protein